MEFEQLFGVSYLTLVDPGSGVYQMYRVPDPEAPFPQDYVIDQNGIVRAWNDRYEPQEIIALVDSLLGVTPTPAPTMTATPTEGPSPTPGTPTETPPPTSTPPCSDLTLFLDMPGHFYSGGQSCYLDAIICNPGTATTETPVFILLAVGNQFWFAPGWVSSEQELDYYAIDLTTGQYTLSVIPPFTWPGNAGSGSGLRFMSAILDPDLSQVISNIDEWEFSFAN